MPFEFKDHDHTTTFHEDDRTSPKDVVPIDTLQEPPPSQYIDSPVKLTLANLPSDILLKIFEDPDVQLKDELYHLATLSRRLNSIALRVFLKACKVNIDELDFYTYINIHARDSTPFYESYEGLAIYLDELPRNMRRLSIFFHRSNLAFAPIVGQLERATKLLEKQETIGNIMLNFPETSHFYTQLGDENLSRWVDSFGRVLNTALEKSAKSIVIREVFYAANSYELVSWPPAPTLTSKFKKMIGKPMAPEPPPVSPMLRGTNWQFVRPKGCAEVFLVKPTEEALRLSKLERLYLEGHALLVPPALEWTLRVLENSPIEEIHISMKGRYYPSSQTWRAVLPNLAKSLGGRLGILTMIGCNVGRALPFLDTMTSLTRLQINFPISKEEDIRPIVIPTLPSLVVLKASFAWATILTTVTQPELKTVIFAFDDFNSYPIDGVANATSQPKVQDIVLELSLGGATIGAISEGLPEFEAFTHLCCTFRYNEVKDSVDYLVGEVLPSFRGLKILVLIDMYSYDRDKVPHLVQALAAQAPTLEAVHVDSIRHDVATGKVGYQPPPFSNLFCNAWS